MEGDSDEEEFSTGQYNNNRSNPGHQTHDNSQFAIDDDETDDDFEDFADFDDGEALTSSAKKNKKRN